MYYYAGNTDVHYTRLLIILYFIPRLARSHHHASILFYNLYDIVPLYNWRDGPACMRGALLCPRRPL